MKKTIFAMISGIVLTLTFPLVSCQHVHEYGEWETVRRATCSKQGIERRFCDCGDYEERTTSLSPHNYSNWVINGVTSQSRTCQECGYSEIQYFKDMENTGGNTDSGNQDTLPNINYGHYDNFDAFWNVCNNSRYDGTSKKIEVVLNPGTMSCDHKTIYIPSYVTDVIFIGNTQGNPYNNLKIVIDSRSTSINVTFRNVRIETNGTILTSNSRNIRLNLSMEGENCSFINTSIASNGSSGKDVNATTAGNAEGREGGRGENGSSAMLLNGECTIESSSSLLIIRGGRGGHGGRGGNAKLGPGARGGDGGNGGNAISGEYMPHVYIASGCTADITGGSGGSGGQGGSGYDWGNAPGDNGNSGNSGIAGCHIHYN